MDKQIKQEEGVAYAQPEPEQEIKEEAPPGHMNFEVKPAHQAFAQGTGNIFDSNSWIYSLALINKIPFGQMLGWVTQLVNTLSNQGNFEYWPLVKLRFRNFAKKSNYYCLILPMSNSFCVMKVWDKDGDIIYYQKIGTQSILVAISQLMKMAGQSSILLIDDEIGIQHHLEQLIKSNAIASVVFIHPSRHTLSIPQGSKGSYRKVKEVMFYCCKKNIKKVPEFETILDNFISFQSGDHGRVSLTLGNWIPECSDWQCLLSIIIKTITEKQGVCSPPQLITFLHDGLRYLQEIMKTYEQFQDKHYPSRSSQKQLCGRCNKKKSEVQCRACVSIMRRPINLCVPTCFVGHHKECRELSVGRSRRIGERIGFFDQKMERICQKINELVEKGGQYDSLLVYLRWSTLEVARRCNLIAEARMNRENQ